MKPFLMEWENLAFTRRKFFFIKSMKGLFETMDPNTIIDFLKKLGANQRYKSID